MFLDVFSKTKKKKLLTQLLDKAINVANEFQDKSINIEM